MNARTTKHTEAITQQINVLLEKKHQLEINRNRLLQLIKHLKKDVVVLNNEHDLLGSGKKNLEKEQALLREEKSAHAKIKEDLEQLSFAERLRLINFPDNLIPDEFTDIVTCIIMDNPIMLDDMPSAVIDESTTYSLKLGPKGMPINPIAPGYVEYEEDAAKKGNIIKSVDGEVKKTLKLPLLKLEIKRFVEKEEAKHNINEMLRLRARETHIIDELKLTDERSKEIEQKIAEINERLKSADQEKAGLNQQIDKIDTALQIATLQKKADDLAMTITELKCSANNSNLDTQIDNLQKNINEVTRLLKEEQQMEQGQIDAILKADKTQLIELRNQQQLIISLENELAHLNVFIFELKGENAEEQKEKVNPLGISTLVSNLTSNQKPSQLLGSHPRGGFHHSPFGTFTMPHNKTIPKSGDTKSENRVRGYGYNISDVD